MLLPCAGTGAVKHPSSEVTVWSISSLFFHCTAMPTVTVIVWGIAPLAPLMMMSCV